MKNLLILIACISFIFTSCDVEKTKSGELPSVDVDMDVDAEAGSLPKFDVDWADVNVGTRTEMVKVPKVVVVMEEVEVEVPYVDVDMPDGGDKEERTLVAEAEVSGTAHNIDIKEVYATGKRLIVVSELMPSDEKIGKETMRVSDRLVINAPEDLDVKHYVIGSRPKGEFNRQFSYVSNKGAIASKMVNGKLIYKK